MVFGCFFFFNFMNSLMALAKNRDEKLFLKGTCNFSCLEWAEIEENVYENLITIWDV